MSRHNCLLVVVEEDVLQPGPTAGQEAGIHLLRAPGDVSASLKSVQVSAEVSHNYLLTCSPDHSYCI